MTKEKLFTFVYTKKGKVVGTTSWFYEDEKEATLRAKEAMDMYKADVVEVHRYDEGTRTFARYISITSKRNDIKWKDTFSSRNVFPADFHECQKIAKQVGYKYLLFNGYVYSADGSLSQELCEEKDLIV
ncbi:hypothetical protein Blue_117 [Bacillus phage Deep Blue]|uniref:Uncharacterized protein n=1 Tax=Bacillus phage Deep Blue TaxID=1792245 RepID=A0A140HLS8_9CAUD|nr:hypothetical protein Blue_117 [Bacillus phage Deep Blue]AMO25940.1 hypothetical protein Blue_117 [Bacillus phage Deep Blue]